MHYSVYKPSSSLAPFIKNYWIIDSGESTSIRQKQRIFSHGCIEINIFYKDNFLLFNNDGTTTKLSGAIISGQKNGYYDLMPTGKTGILSIIFKPHGAGLFFKIPMKNLMNKNIQLKELIGNNSEKLEESISQSKEPRDKITILESFLINNLIESNLYSFSRISECINQVNKSPDKTNIKELSNSTFLSIRQFERIFAEYSGLSPKHFLKTIRFQRALYLKQINAGLNLTQLAYECGYYDQAHFSNDFKDFTGFTPKKYFTRFKPFSDYFSF